MKIYEVIVYLIKKKKLENVWGCEVKIICKGKIWNFKIIKLWLRDKYCFCGDIRKIVI